MTKGEDPISKDQWPRTSAKQPNAAEFDVIAVVVDVEAIKSQQTTKIETAGQNPPSAVNTGSASITFPIAVPATSSAAPNTFPPCDNSIAPAY